MWSTLRPQRSTDSDIVRNVELMLPPRSPGDRRTDGIGPYKACLIYELHKRGLQVATEVAIPVIYDGVRLDAKFRVDLIVENCVVVELKAVERILDVHDAQLLSHLKLTGHKLGFRINFNVVHLKDGIKRMVNGL